MEVPLGRHLFLAHRAVADHLDERLRAAAPRCGCGSCCATRSRPTARASASSPSTCASRRRRSSATSTSSRSRAYVERRRDDADRRIVRVYADPGRAEALRALPRGRLPGRRRAARRAGRARHRDAGSGADHNRGYYDRAVAAAYLTTGKAPAGAAGGNGSAPAGPRERSRHVVDSHPGRGPRPRRWRTVADEASSAPSSSPRCTRATSSRSTGSTSRCAGARSSACSAQRRGQDHHRGHAHHARDPDERAGVRRRHRRRRAPGRGQAADRRRPADQHPRPVADGVGEPLLPRPVLRHERRARARPRRTAARAVPAHRARRRRRCWRSPAAWPSG